MKRPPIYLDYNATAPCDPRVVESMLPYFNQRFGNTASADHRYGWQAKDAVEDARGQVAQLIGARAKRIVFTSGATESVNLALKGLDRKSTRLNSSHVKISYAVFCLKKKKKI